MGKPVAARAASASTRRDFEPPAATASFFSSRRLGPLTRATTTSSSTENTSDFTMAPSSTPTAAAASAAVWVESSNWRASTATPSSAAAARKARTLRCTADETARIPGMRAWVVAGGLVEGPDGLLLVQNRRRDGSLDWSPPGGVIEVADGESVRVGLTREVEEETGIRVTEWIGPVYEVEAVAAEMGWTMRVEVHRALGY